MPAEETAQGTFFYETARAWGEKELGLFGESAGRHPHLYAGCPAGAVLTGYRGAAGAFRSRRGSAGCRSWASGKTPSSAAARSRIW